MTYVHSHFGVYAVIIKDDSILLIKKARGPYTGLYDLPGGSLEATELLEEALHREIIEETGCKAVAIKPFVSTSVRYAYTQEDGTESLLRHIGVLYQVEITGTPRMDADGEDSNGCVWVPLDQLQQDRITPFVAQACEKYRV